MNEQTAIKLSCTQVSDLLTILERFGIEPDMSDAHASTMFSELLIKGARCLDTAQARAFYDNV